MRLVQLKTDNFRLLKTLSLPLSGRLNFFCGSNAAGKTSLLESVYCLGRGKSFRGSSPQELAGDAGRHWSLYGKVEHAQRAADHIGLAWSPLGSDIRLNNETGSTLQLIQTFPVQILEPGMHKVLQDGPTYRRGLLDWGVFHVEQGFLGIWRRYRRALRQRNQALRQNGPDSELAAWEPELVAAGTQLHQFRQIHLEAILTSVRQRTTALLEDEGAWRFELHPGWSGDGGLAEALARHRDRDRRMGATLDGPHRAELRIHAGEHAIRNRISRGQQKLLIAALLLAQCDQIHRVTGIPPLLLVDDFAAELADRYQQTLLTQLSSYPGQVLVTAFESKPALRGMDQAAMFHVERGRIEAA